LRMDSPSKEGPKNDSEDTLLKKDREEKLRKKKQKIKQHGKGLGKIYRDAVRKRGKGKR
jgi:hypothetical protein